MKRIEIATVILAVMLCPIRSEAKTDYVQLYRTDKEAYIKAVTCTDEESIAAGRYSEYQGVDELKDKAVTAGASKSTIAEYKKKKEELKKAKEQVMSSTINKGIVTGIDELHVIGLPADPETGYTLPGDYTNVPTSGTDVYGYDELHVAGAASRPDGYTTAGRY